MEVHTKKRENVKDKKPYISTVSGIFASEKQT